MIRECNVIINNDEVTVFVYNGIEVQIPSIHQQEATKIFVDEKDGIYTVVDNVKTTLPELPTPKAKTYTKKIEKKTTKKDSSRKEDMISSDIESDQSET